MLKLIINADDLGLSENVNEGIVEAWKHGVVTSASLMACGPSFDHAVDLLKKNPGLDFGVHLTLVEERPLSPAAQIPGLIGADGRFHAHAFVFLRKYFLGRISAEAVGIEWVAQIRRVVNAGLNPSHLNSHQHLHFLPKLRVVITDLAREYGIPAVRLPRCFRDVLGGGAGRWARYLQMLILSGLCRSGDRKGLASPEVLMGFCDSGRLDFQALEKIVQHLPRAGVCEIICHPGRSDPGSPYRHWHYQWDRELAAFCDPRLAAIITERGAELISYKALGGPFENK